MYHLKLFHILSTMVLTKESWEHTTWENTNSGQVTRDVFYAGMRGNVSRSPFSSPVPFRLTPFS